MMKIFTILSIIFIGINSLSHYEDEWTKFKLIHGKEFISRGEEKYRKEIFISNLQKIEEHNKLYEQGLKTYSMKINKFADLHHTEFNRIYKGFKISEIDKSSIKSIPFKSSRTNIPASIDWTDLGAVTEVKDQRKCGSCWAFASTGALEGQLFRKTGNLYSISEQNLVDCATEATGCSGGDMVPAFFYIMRNKGIDTEKGYPYEGYEDECRYKIDYNITSVTGAFMVREGDENNLKLAVGMIGPIAVAIDATHNGFRFYNKGIYYDENCKNDKMNLDHAVLVVGYGTEDGQDYWLVKNSWNTSWGDFGYIKMARNRNNHCGIATHAIYPII